MSKLSVMEVVALELLDKGLSVLTGMSRYSLKNKLSEAQSLFALLICSVCKKKNTRYFLNFFFNFITQFIDDTNTWHNKKEKKKKSLIIFI